MDRVQENDALSQDTGYRRINNMLIAFWEQARADAAYPRENDIAVEHLQSIWGSCFLMRLLPGKPGYEYMYVGSDLVEAYGGQDYEKDACERLAFSAHEMDEEFTRHIDHTVQSAVPTEIDGEFTNDQGLQVRYRSVMLPIGDDESGDVAFVLGGMRWKFYL